MTMAAPDFDHLISSIRKHNNEKNDILNLRNYQLTHIDQDQVEQLMSVIFEGRFTHLDFSEQNLPADLMKLVVQSISVHYSLRTIDIQPDLTHLYLGGNDLRECSEILEAFVKDKNCALEVLDIAGDMLPTHFLWAMRNNVSVKELHISLNTGSTKTNQLMDAFQEVIPLLSNLEILHLNCKNTFTAVLVAAFNAIQKNPTIHTLRLSSVENGYGQSDEALAALIKASSRIQTLEFKRPALTHTFGFQKTIETLLIGASSVKNVLFDECHSPAHLIGMFYAKNTEAFVKQPHAIESFTYHADEPIYADLFEVINYFPLKSLTLANAKMNNDQHLSDLLKLIETKKDTLEFLDVSNNLFHISNNRPNDFLRLLADALQGCQRLYHVDLSGMEFSLAEGHKFIRRLRAQNPFIQTIKLDFIHPYFQHVRKYFEDDIIRQFYFLLEDTQLRNSKKSRDETFLLRNAKKHCAGYPGKLFMPWQFETKNLHMIDAFVEGDWKSVKKFYLDRIDRILKGIKSDVDYHHGPYRVNALYHHDFFWTDERQEIFNLANEKKYAEFQQEWLAQRIHERADSRMTMMFDWVDEALYCYADAMLCHGIELPSWAIKYLSWPMQSLETIEATIDGVELDRVSRENRNENDDDQAIHLSCRR
ncbi:MAG: hypothetical protein SFW66_08300 [Gammaproteobacteria bacterium]|nr:hypothetical protein [Gammaproteobacteria bacterium]